MDTFFVDDVSLDQSIELAKRVNMSRVLKNIAEHLGLEAYNVGTDFVIRAEKKRT